MRILFSVTTAMLVSRITILFMKTKFECFKIGVIVQHVLTFIFSGDDECLIYCFHIVCAETLNGSVIVIFSGQGDGTVDGGVEHRDCDRIHTSGLQQWPCDRG